MFGMRADSMQTEVEWEFERCESGLENLLWHLSVGKGRGVLLSGAFGGHCADTSNSVTKGTLNVVKVCFESRLSVVQ